MTLVGQQIGRYRILEQLGQGGMSVVYRGLDTTLEREVAVKVLHAHLASQPGARERLLREARAVARLRHPNILEVFEHAGEGTEVAYLVTEYIRGMTLREFMTREALHPPELGAMVVLALARALAHAHQAGVLHRDLKPENVMVRDDGVLKLMDFGIARLVDRDERMTMTGTLIGSPAHMAPEIIEGEPAGAPADVFSLGTMLYLFATGRLPFDGPTTTATLKRIVDGVYDDPRGVAPTVSDGLAAIIATCLQRQPSRRYADAAALGQALEAHLAGVGLTRCDEELRAFFLRPGPSRAALVTRLLEVLLTRAESLASRRKTALAIAALDQALAHCPRHPRAQALLSTLQLRRRQVQRRHAIRRAGLVVLGVASVIVLGVALERAARVAPLTGSSAAPPEEVTLGQAPVPPAPSPALQVPAPRAGLAVPGGSPRRPATSGPIEVAVVVRPFGVVRVDGGPPTPEALARHSLRLTPGRHRFTVSCESCDPATPPVERTVRPDEDVLLVAPLRASRVSFEGFPEQARVRIAAEERTVAEARQRPFEIATPTGGSPKLLHLVDYTVTLDGEVLERASRWIAPGASVVLGRGGT